MRARVGRSRRPELAVLCVAFSSLVASCSSGTASTGTDRAPTASTALNAAVRRTMGASSLTMHLPGTTVTFEAPNLSQVTMQDPNYPSYPPSGTDAQGQAEVLPYLHLALGLSATNRTGNVYTVRGHVTGPPDILQTLIYHPPNDQGTRCSSFSTACSFLTITYWHSKKRYLVTGRIAVANGYVTSETFVLHGFGRPGSAFEGTVRYSGINASDR